MKERSVKVVDTTLRDGMHAKSHQFTVAQVKAIARGLDEAGVGMIEVSHGDGLGGSSIQYGLAAATDQEYLQGAAEVLRTGRLTVLLIPGIGTQKDLEMAKACGACAVRVATHCTEADIAEQHIQLAKKLGLTVGGFLMMAHMATPAKLLEQAKLMESYGADFVYITDSAGALLPGDVAKRVSLLRDNLRCGVGFHAHNNLSLAVGNTLAAIEAGASIIDASLNGLGAGAGNTPLQPLIAALHKLGIETGIDLFKLFDLCAEVDNLIGRPDVVGEAGILLGYAGVYSSFILHSYRAAERFGIDVRQLLLELGKKHVVGGQEDMILDVAYELSRKG